MTVKRKTTTRKTSRKKTARKTSAPAFDRVLARAVAAGARTTSAPANSTMVVRVEVDASHIVPYAIGFDGSIVLDGLLPAQTTVAMAPGHHLLSWSFNHSFESDWSHRVSVVIDGGAPLVIDQKSSQSGNNPVSGGTRVFDA